jgi:hypothetical protein
LSTPRRSAWRCCAPRLRVRRRAAAAELAARSGVDDVVLFADVANPVSNAT